MLSRLVLVFLFVVQANSLSVLTDDKSQATNTDGETVLVRQLLNQETLIRMALDRKVNDLVKGMAEMKKDMETSNQKLQDAKREIEINNQQLQDAKREIRTNNQQLQDAKRETEASKQQLRDAIIEIETNNQQLQDAKKEIETNNQQLKDAKKEIETNNQQLKDAKRETETNNQQLLDAKREIETNNQQLQDATKEIAALINKNSALKAEWQVQSNLTAFLSDNLKTTINTVKQSQNSQQELSSAVSSLQVFQRNMSVLTAKDTPVAFTAGITSASDSWEGDIFVFPHVITNKGHGYSSSSGKFTAPRDGTYVFTLTVVSYGSNSLTLYIVHDAVSKVRTYSTGYASYQTGTNLVVLELDRGDAVWIKRGGGRGYYTNSVPLTTFSGFIL
uniref:Eisosome protein 1-like n=1 Tax=Crassostrea virginica TaxID=6565 RepID=A0A8B8D0Z7_CRAVI|nr:eisosome protein 1-like [Crassostrea virginica]